MSNITSAGGAGINLLQITDCHLMKAEKGELLGVVTKESFLAVLDQIETDIAGGVCPSPDLILATGDITQDASVEAYQLFKSEIEKRFSAPMRWFPGNHDDRAVMQSVTGDGSEYDKVFQLNGWQVVGLDSSVSGSVHGRLSSEELEVLRKALSDEQTLHTLVAFHHQPVEVGSTWIDRIGLKNNDELFELIDLAKSVRGILWGHIHQDFESTRNQIPLFATPSTCIQFTPQSEDFGVEAKAPGYRWMHLKADGSIDTQVRRADSYEFALDMESNGY